MALSEWTIYKNKILAKATLVTTSHIAGGASLVLSDNGQTNPQIVMMRTRTSEKAFLQGKMRTLIRADQSNGAGAGFVFMTDREDVTGGVGNCYGLFYGKTRVAGTNEIVVSKFLDGLENPPISTLFYTTYSPVGVFAFEVEWESDLGSVGGTRIIVRRSSSTVDTVTFDSLQEVYNDIDTTSPLVVTKGEGIAFHTRFGGSNQFILDKSSMIQTV